MTIQPANDNPPIITSDGGGPTAALYIDENSTAVTQVMATDEDAGSLLTFSLSGGADADKFQIDSASGALSFISAPDFETPTDDGGNNVYDVQVKVSDGLFSDTQDISVTVNDLFENHSPVIDSGGGGDSAAISVVENGTLVATVTATDPDGGVVNFSISGGDDADKFYINPTTGELDFVSAPDFENPADDGGDNVYHVQVWVDDGLAGGSDTQDIAVTVTDGNDPPVITSNPPDGIFPVGVAIVEENSTAVTTVIATDADPGSVLTFSLGLSPDSGLFTIDADSGELSFIAPPDFESPNNFFIGILPNLYAVEVQASDGVNTTVQELAVFVVNADDNSPEITSDGGGQSAAVSVAENSTAVTTVTAADLDLLPPPIPLFPIPVPVTLLTDLAYSISEGDDYAMFTIDASTGALSFISAPDFENPQDSDADNVYEVQVEVSDGTHFDFQNISVTVTNQSEAGDPVPGDDAWFITSAKASLPVGLLLLNDTDPESDPLSVVGVGGAVDGHVKLSAGIVSFTPLAGATSGSFTYDVSDGSHTATGSVAVQVTAVTSGSDTITVPDTPGLLSYVDGRGGNDSLTGGANDDTIVGNTGNDTLEGGGGTNQLLGGAGNDVFNNVDAGDHVSAGDGVDLINTSISWTLANDEERLTLLGVGNLNGAGNGSANVILGNDGNNMLFGLGRNDNLDGGAGNDLVDGGAGKDRLTGGSGDDTFRFDALSDSGTTAATRDLINGFAHGDKIDLSAIDADSGTPGDQAFTFHKNFTHHVGEVQYDVLSASSILVSVDLDGDAVADFSVRLHTVGGFGTLQATDFTL